MRSGGDPAIPARIDRRRGSPDLVVTLQKPCHATIRRFWAHLPLAGHMERRVFRQLPLFAAALPIASPQSVYYNSMCVKPGDPAPGNADNRRP